MVGILSIYLGKMVQFFLSDSEDYDSSVAVFSKSTSRLSENVNNVNQSVQEGREDDEAVKNNREDNNALVVEKCIFNANECAHYW